MFVFNGYDIRNVQKLTEKLDKSSEPSLEGIFTGTFTEIRLSRKDDHNVIIKQSIRCRNISHEAAIFEYLQLSNTNNASTGCIEMFGFNIDQSPSFIVLEEFGEDLTAYLSPHTSHEFKRSIVLKLLEALQSLHNFDVMHGDLKPQNILCKEKGGVTIKLCDLDSARIMTSQDIQFPYDDVTKKLKYTPSWVSPEVYTKSEEHKGGSFKASLAIDIFPLGLIAVMLESKDNRFSNGYVLPDIDTDDYKKALSDQEYLVNNVLKIDDSNPYKHLLLNMCSINITDRKTVSELLREIREIVSTTRIVQEKRKLEQDKQFLQDEVIDKMDNMLECLEKFSKVSITLLEENKSLRDIFDQVNNNLIYMNEHQHDEHKKKILELNQIQASLDMMPDTLKAVVASQIEQQMKSIHNELHTIIQNTHTVPTLAIIIKKPPKGMNRFKPSNLITETYSLYFVCSHTLQPVICGPNGDGFVFKKVKDGISSFLKKVSPIIKVSLVLLKVAVSLYGIPLPLPNLNNIGIDASNAYLNDSIHTFCNEYSDNVPNLLDELESSIMNGLKNSDDIMSKLIMNTQSQREAYEAIISFLDDYKPLKLGLVKRTSQSGITQWIKDDVNVIKSFDSNDGRRVPVIP